MYTHAQSIYSKAIITYRRIDDIETVLNQAIFNKNGVLLF